MLVMRGIDKRFGPTQALRDVNLEVAAGQVLALIGENGAGKSTLLKILSGAHLPDGGTIMLGGATYRPRGPSHARRAGVAMIYQELNLAPDLSVEDNVLLGQRGTGAGTLVRSAQRQRVREALSTVGLDRLPPQASVGKQSVATQQLIEIARALASDARIILFDEPTSSLPQQDVVRLFTIIQRLKASGIAVLYISHFLEEVREVADTFAVLRDGRSVGAGKIDEVDDREIISLMVGRDVDELYPRVPHKPAETRVVVNGLHGAPLPKGVHLVLRRGEIFGIAGLVGAGRTELLRCLFGLDHVTAGSVQIAERKLSRSVRARMRAGFGLLSEDRKREGLAQDLSIEENLTLGGLQRYSTWGWLNLSRRREVANQWVRKVEVKAHAVTQPVAQLSGGNQQKVAIARILHQDAEIVLLDEPTKGIDVGTKAELYRMMGELAAQGRTVVFVSSYLPELMAVCDRIGVMARGRLREVRNAEEWTEEQVMAAAISQDDET